MIFRTILVAALAGTIISCAPSLAIAGNAGMAAMQMTPATIKVGSLEISGPFARATPPKALVGGGYLTITNRGNTADRLVSATSPAAGIVSLHEMSMSGSVMKMRVLPNGIDIPAGATVKLAPNGLHMMFEHLHGGFVQGKTVPVTLSFEKAGKVTVHLPVLGIAANGPGVPTGNSMGGMKM